MVRTVPPLIRTRPMPVLLAALLLLFLTSGVRGEEPTPELPGPRTPGAETPAVDTPAKTRAIELYNTGVELFQVGQVQAEKGNHRGQKDLLTQAVKNFEEALALDPELVDAQSNIGFAYLTLDDRKKAIKAFKKALEINDRHLNTLNGLSTTYALEGNLDEALATFDKLTILDPGNPQYFFNQGSVLQKAKRFDDAKAAYLEALRLEPKEQRSLFNMGTLLENQGQYAEALNYYNRAKNVNISNPIGLEAIHRVKALELLLAEQQKTKAQE